MDVLFFMSIFRLYPGFKMSFEHNSARKNVFLSARFYWNSRLYVRELDQKCKFGGPIGYGDSYLELLFRSFKVFTLLPILHGAAGVVWAHSGKGPGYCYMIARGPNSCLLGRATGLFFCLYVKFFLPSIINCVDFRNCMYSILSGQTEALLRNWEFLLTSNLRDTHFVLQKSTNPQNKRFGAQKICTELCGTVDVWITMSFQTFFLEL